MWVQMVAKNKTGHEVTRELISVLPINYRVSNNTLLATLRDQLCVNNVAMRILKVVYPFIVNLGCFSHRCERCWGAIQGPYPF